MMQIQKSTLQFLKDLQKNNNREWFALHKEAFLKEKLLLEQFLAALTSKLNKHDAIEKRKLYRIYRDVRFSKDKTPYKNSLGTVFIRKGVALRGSYYLHIEPNNSFLAGGFWQPNKEDLNRIRKEFEIDASEIRTVLANKNFKKVFEGKLEGNELKAAPRGFDKNHLNIDLIRKKGFVAVRKFTDKEILSPNFINIVDNSFKTLRPFFDLMSDILTTNLNGESVI